MKKRNKFKKSAVSNLHDLYTLVIIIIIIIIIIIFINSTELTRHQLVKKSPHFMEPKCSLPYSQGSSACFYPEPDQSSPCPPFLFLKSYFNIMHSSTPGYSTWYCFVRFTHQNYVCTSPLPHMCYIAAHLIHLDFITRIMFGEQ
jgi:hypothetical protein